MTTTREAIVSAAAGRGSTSSLNGHRSVRRWLFDKRDYAGMYCFRQYLARVALAVVLGVTCEAFTQPPAAEEACSGGPWGAARRRTLGTCPAFTASPA